MTSAMAALVASMTTAAVVFNVMVSGLRCIRAVSVDGQRFLMVKDDSGSGRINLVLNWAEELKAKVPTK